MKGIYCWKLGVDYGNGWEDDDIEGEEAWSFYTYRTNTKHTLLFLEEKFIKCRHDVKRSPGLLWRMLLTDLDTYKMTKIIWTNPHWVSPIRKPKT